MVGKRTSAINALVENIDSKNKDLKQEKVRQALKQESDKQILSSFLDEVFSLNKAYKEDFDNRA